MIAISSRCARISVRPAVGRDDRGHDRGVGDAGRAELGEPFRPRAKDGSRVIPRVIVGRGDRDSHDRASGGEPDGELREAALAWAQQLAKGPTFAHAVTKRLLRYALDHGSRQADRYLLDVAPDLLESRDMQYAVDLLLTQGARKFIQNQAEVIFEGR